MGGTEFEPKGLLTAVQGTVAKQERQATELSIATPGGRFQVRWDEGGREVAPRSWTEIWFS